MELDAFVEEQDWGNVQSIEKVFLLKMSIFL